MTLQEAIQALHEYAATEQTGPDGTELASAFREQVGESVGELLQSWADDGSALRREAQKLAEALREERLGNRELDAVLRKVSEAALNTLSDCAAERSARVDSALDLLCVSTDADEPAFQKAIDGINAARGVQNRPRSAQYVRPENYGVDHMSGRGRQGAEYLREINRELVREAKRAQSPDAAEAKNARSDVKELLMRKMYLKAAAAPNALVDPQAVETAAWELSADAKLMDAVAAAKDARTQEKVLREHVRRAVRGEPEQERSAPERTRTMDAPKRPDDPRVLGG